MDMGEMRRDVRRQNRRWNPTGAPFVDVVVVDALVYLALIDLRDGRGSMDLWGGSSPWEQGGPAVVGEGKNRGGGGML